MSNQFIQNANDHAQVGSMVSQNNGNIFVGAGMEVSRRDIAWQISDLRVELHRARQNAELQPEHCAAAEHELDVVDEALPANTPERRRKATTALLKLRGLVGDIADLAGKVTAIIAAIKGTS